MRIPTEREIRTALQQREKQKMIQNRNKMPAINKIAVSFVSTIILLFPTWIWLACYLFLSPSDFWQKLVIFGLGLYFLGGLQFLLAIGLVFWLVAVWND